MPAQKLTPPTPRTQVVLHQTKDAASIDRMIDSVTEQLARLTSQSRSVVTVDLVVGDNRINHLLGRKPSGCNLTPTDADASFAWALTEKTDRQAVVTIVGVAQPGATLEFW